VSHSKGKNDAKIINDLLGELSGEDRVLFQENLNTDPQLATEYQKFDSLLKKLHTVAVPPSQTPDLSVRIMASIIEKEEKVWWKSGVGYGPFTYRSWIHRSMTYRSIIGAVAIAIVAVKILPEFFYTHPTITPIGPKLPQSISAAPSGEYSIRATYNDARIAESSDVILTFFNGAFGAIVMLLSALLGIVFLLLSSVKKIPSCRIAALICFIIAIAFYVMRSMISTWFNDVSLIAS
jgi:hypothetical protein